MTARDGSCVPPSRHECGPGYRLAMTIRLAADRHTSRIVDRSLAAVAPRGPASFVWGDFVTEPGTVVTGAAGAWSPLSDGRPGLLVTATAADGIEIAGIRVDGAAP